VLLFRSSARKVPNGTERRSWEDIIKLDLRIFGIPQYVYSFTEGKELLDRMRYR
jgi:hypothetical protein